MMRKVRVFLEMIKFEHTLFALPFAFLGAILGSITHLDRLPSWAEIGWIIVAMVGARSAAMGLNRLIDRRIDARNPRTATRAIPAGLLRSNEVAIFIGVSFILLFAASFRLDPLVVKLLPIAVFMLVIYSYTKRFTWLCHVVLGFTIALAPLGGWVAITGAADLSAYILFVSVAFWTAGFDIVYACQDFEYDRGAGLHSIPARFGLKRALWIARLFHVIPAVGFLALFWMTDLGWAYLVGAVIAIAILVYQHRLVKPEDLRRVDAAFFGANGTLSVMLFVFAFIDLVVLQQW